MNKGFLYLLVLIFGIFVSSELFAQDKSEHTIYMKDGSIIRGKIIEINPKLIKIQIEDESIVVRDFEQVYNITKEEVKSEKEEIVIPEHSLLKFDFSAGLGRLGGDTTYQIGGTVVDPSASYNYHFPISELEFPLDVYMISVEGSIEFAEKWKISVGLKKNITDDAGKMKDSDWGVPFEDPPGSESWWWYGPNSLDIYSESDADLDALIVDINLRYRFYEKSNWSFITGLGYLRQNFDYACRLIEQWSPSGLSGYDYNGTGEVGLAYEVTYNIPYMQIGAQLKIKDKFRFEAILGYSPIVNVEDKDSHLLRDPPIFAKGDCDGDAILFSFTGRYDFLKNWFLTTEFGQAQIDTEGTQKNYINGEWVWTTDETIKSEQIYYALTVGYEF
jgi:outer membrane protease